MNPSVAKPREMKRAMLLHEQFTWVHQEHQKGQSLRKLFHIISPSIRRHRIPFCTWTAYRLFREWSQDSRPESLLRKWKPGTARIPDSQIALAEITSISTGLSLIEAAKLHAGGHSPRTIYRRSRIKNQINRLNILRRKQARVWQEISKTQETSLR